MRKFILGLCACLLIPVVNLSAETSADVGSWCNLMLVKSWGKPYATARIEHRSYDNMSATECWFAAVGGGYGFAKWLKADLGYEFWQLPSAGGKTVHKGTLGLTASLVREGLNVNVREKFEQSFGSSSSGTLRSRLRAQYKIGTSRFTPYLMYEHFQTLGTGWQRSLHYAGTEIVLADHHFLDFFYLYHLFPNGGATTGCHVIGVGYNFIF